MGIEGQSLAASIGGPNLIMITSNDPMIMIMEAVRPSYLVTLFDDIKRFRFLIKPSLKGVCIINAC